LRIVLDSNIFLFAFGFNKQPACVALVDLLSRHKADHKLRIPRLVLREIRRNLTPSLLQDAMKYAHRLAIPDEDFVVPFELGTQYERRGLKPADAFIAAYTEWVGADCLVSENRHFLGRQKNLPFRVVNAEQCLKWIKSGRV
jgi:predicted nucleic acid-binding protein